MRKIVVDGKTFKWRIGRSNISIRSKNVHLVLSFTIAFPNEDIEQAEWKKCFHITPIGVEGIIRKWGLV